MVQLLTMIQQPMRKISGDEGVDNDGNDHEDGGGTVMLKLVLVLVMV